VRYAGKRRAKKSKVKSEDKTSEKPWRRTQREEGGAGAFGGASMLAAQDALAKRPSAARTTNSDTKSKREKHSDVNTARKKRAHSKANSLNQTDVLKRVKKKRSCERQCEEEFT